MLHQERINDIMRSSMRKEVEIEVKVKAKGKRG